MEDHAILEQLVNHYAIALDHILEPIANRESFNFQA